MSVRNSVDVWMVTTEAECGGRVPKDVRLSGAPWAEGHVSESPQRRVPGDVEVKGVQLWDSVRVPIYFPYDTEKAANICPHVC